MDSHGARSSARRTRRPLWARSRRPSQPVELITSARKSPLEGWHRRRRTYIVLQMLRIPLLAIAVLVLWLTHNMALSVTVACVSVPLPWIAVLLANETGEVERGEQRVYKPAVVREQRRIYEQELVERQLGTGRSHLTSLTSGADSEVIVLDAEDLGGPGAQRQAPHPGPGHDHAGSNPGSNPAENPASEAASNPSNAAPDKAPDSPADGATEQLPEHGEHQRRSE